MIERLVRRKGLRGQFNFALQARDVVPPRDDVVLAKSHRGLHVLALDEQGLVVPLRALRDAFGPQVRIEAEARGAPLMEVRIGLERRDLPRVRPALERRGANPSEEFVGVHYCGLRFEAPAGALLGLPAELARLTGGRATCQILLTGHE